MQLDEDFDCCLVIEWQFYMDVNFGVVDKIDPLQTSVNDFWHCIWRHSIFWTLTDMTTTCDGDIDLESWEYMPVGHIWKFDLDMKV